jgi:hypothetical protein
LRRFPTQKWTPVKDKIPFNFKMVPKGGLDRVSLGDLAIGRSGAAQGFRPPQGRALLLYPLSALRRFESPLRLEMK